MRLGIIGSGFGVYGILPAFLAIEECEVISYCSRNPERFLKYKESRKLSQKINVYSDWREMFEKENLDAVAIAVIPEYQFDIAMKALEIGLHVFAEKPLTVTFEQAKQLKEKAEEKKLTTAVDFIFPEIYEWRIAKENIDNLISVKASWDFLSYDLANSVSGWKTSKGKGGGAASFYVSHMLHYIEYFAGEVSSMSSLFSHSEKSFGGAEVGVDALIYTKKNVVCNLHFSCASAYKKEHKIVFTFERGVIVLVSDGSVTGFSISFFGDTSGCVFPDEVQVRMFSGEDERVGCVFSIAKRFVSSIKEKREMEPSFKNGLDVQRLIMLLEVSNLA
jgi:predicted dehydrogenase